MEAFHWIVVPISTVLGLTVTRVLLGFVAAFKARAQVSFYWMPVMLAVAIVGEGLQFWWAMFELSTMTGWSLFSFTLLLMMIMALFAAGALVVPAEGERDMHAAFARDGRWAMVCLALFHLLAIPANSLLWGVAIATPTQALQVLLAVLCMISAFSRQRRWQEVVAVAYVATSVIDTFPRRS